MSLTRKVCPLPPLEILEYADFLGVQLPDEDYMLELAKEGITAQLPVEWQACQTPDGDLVYRNIRTKAVQEEHPLDEIYRQKVIELREYVRKQQFEEDDQSLGRITERPDDEVSIDENLSNAEFKSSDLNKGQYLESSSPMNSTESFHLANIISSKGLDMKHSQLQ